MRYHEKDMEQILKKDLVISSEVEEKMQKTYRRIQNENKGNSQKVKTRWRKLTTAAAILALALTATAGTAAASYLSEHSEFLQGLFGNSTKESVGARQIPVGANDGSTVNVDAPAKEYIPVDEEKADQLIGGHITEEQTVVQLGEHTLTVENYVTDGNAALVYFTLERKGGVTALYGDADTNNGKGAYFTDDADFYFTFTDQNGDFAADNMYLDVEKSTSEKYYLYSYLVWTADEDTEVRPQLVIDRYPMSRGKFNSLSGKENEKANASIEREILALPDSGTVDMKKLEQDGEWICSYSPISMNINMLAFAENKELASDPYCIDSIELKFRDGSSYVLYEKDKIDNAGYTCGVGTEYRTAFNRIIDPDELSQIVINHERYAICK